MAPGPVPHHTQHWRDAHSFYLLSPLMGFLSRAWSRLRGPGESEPWLVETATGRDQIEDQAVLLPGLVPWGYCSQENEAEDNGVPKEVGGVALSYPPETWEHSTGDDKHTETGEQDGSKEQESTDGLSAPRCPCLQGADKNPEEEVAGEEGVTRFAYPSPHWEGLPVVEEENEESLKKEAGRASTCSISPGCRPSILVYCPEAAEYRTTEEKGIENKAKEPPLSRSSSGSHSRVWGGEAKASSSHTTTGSDFLKAWVYPPREDTEEEASDAGSAEEEGEAEALSSLTLTGSAFLKTWVYHPGEDTEEEEDCELESVDEEGETEVSSADPPASTSLKAWVYGPGEDTEEEDDDSDCESAEEEGEAEATHTGSAFLKAWVYRPGEDTEDEEEDGDSGSAEEKEEAQASLATPSMSAFLKAWVYCPGEDAEEEDECEENEDPGDSDAADSCSRSPKAQGTSSCRNCLSGVETKEEEWREAEPSSFRVAFYLPGEKPAPWAAPKLPLRLQRRLQRQHKFSEPPICDQDPETGPKARKVQFSEKVTVHFLTVWAGPAQAARRGPWEQLARDRSRFARRIAQAQEELGPCFTPASRARAWTRLGNSPLPLPLRPALPQTLPSTEVLPQAMPSPHTETPPPSLSLSERRG